MPCPVSCTCNSIECISCIRRALRFSRGSVTNCECGKFGCDSCMRQRMNSREREQRQKRLRLSTSTPRLVQRGPVAPTVLTTGGRYEWDRTGTEPEGADA